MTFCVVYVGVSHACEQSGFTEWLAGKISKEDEKNKRCEKEWDDAVKRCQKLLSQPYPSRRQTGGHHNLMDCARGFVSEECGGNPID